MTLALLGALGLGCGDTDSSTEGPSTGEFPKDALVTVTSKQGKLRLATWTSPEQPPSRGTLRVRLLITDTTSGANVAGLKLAMSPEMPSMGHGTPVIPKIEDSGEGVYLASDVNLFMAGRWDLRVTIAGSVTDEAVIPVDVR
jgi:hypothetical protein